MNLLRVAARVAGGSAPRRPGTQMARVYAWDQVMLTVFEYDVPAPPPGLSPDEALADLDRKVSELVDDPDEMETYGNEVRVTGGVAVLDAKFGRDQETHLYYCQDPARAKALADAELGRYFEDQE